MRVSSLLRAMLHVASSLHASMSGGRNAYQPCVIFHHSRKSRGDPAILPGLLHVPEKAGQLECPERPAGEVVV